MTLVFDYLDSAFPATHHQTRGRAQQLYCSSLVLAACVQPTTEKKIWQDLVSPKRKFSFFIRVALGVLQSFTARLLQLVFRAVQLEGSFLGAGKDSIGEALTSSQKDEKEEVLA
jgi:hypothetical protein